jgi:hypothetical protein
MYKVKKTFISDCTNMSLLDVAWRWRGIDLKDAEPNVTQKGHSQIGQFFKKLLSFKSSTKETVILLPVEVRDKLTHMMRAQLDSDLWVVQENGHVVKDWKYIENYEDFIPGDNMNWDGTKAHLKELHFQFMRNVTSEHENLTSYLNDVIYHNKPFLKEHLDQIHVNKENLAEWAYRESLPFPDFWFSDSEKETLFSQWRNEDQIKTYIQECEIQGINTDNDDFIHETLLKFDDDYKTSTILSAEEFQSLLFMNEEETQAFLSNRNLNANDYYSNFANKSLPDTGKLTQEDIDIYWSSIKPLKQAKILYREFNKSISTTTNQKTNPDEAHKDQNIIYYLSMLFPKVIKKCNISELNLRNFPDKTCPDEMYWSRLQEQQQARILCKSIAKAQLLNNPNLRPIDILNENKNSLEMYGRGYYSPRTLKLWISQSKKDIA